MSATAATPPASRPATECPAVQIARAGMSAPVAAHTDRLPARQPASRRADPLRPAG